MPDIRNTVKKLKLNKAFYNFKKISCYCILPFSHKKSKLDCDTARSILDGFSPEPDGTCFAENKLTEPFEYDLQIIIPAYNVENYLKECMDSVLNQKTDYKINVILIDDGSTDKTPEIADSYAIDSRVTVIHQKNRGFSGARNRGLENITAKYIAFVDSDDIMCDKAIDALMKAAFDYDADIVEGGHYHLFGKDRIRQPNIPETRTVDAQKDLKGHPWGKVYRSSLFGNMKFPEGFWFEDSINSFLIFPQVKTAVRVPEYVYIYRVQQDSITRTAPSKPKCTDTYWITEMLIKEHKALGLEESEEYLAKICNQIIINCKRISKMPEKVQESVFILTCALADDVFKEDTQSGCHRSLKKALKKRDYGAYRLYCRTHN